MSGNPEIPILDEPLLFCFCLCFSCFWDGSVAGTLRSRMGRFVGLFGKGILQNRVPKSIFGCGGLCPPHPPPGGCRPLDPCRPCTVSWGIRRRLQQEKLVSRNYLGNRKIPLSPWRFVARVAYALHHGNTGSAKSWGASTPPNSRVRTDGEKWGLPHPGEWFFNASESDLSDGHLIFARDRVEFCAFGFFWAMSESGLPGAPPAGDLEPI